MCPAGFDGPRCQQTRHSFDGSGWAWYKPLSTCAVGKLSIEFATEAEDGLLLYAGPMVDPAAGEWRTREYMRLSGWGRIYPR